MQAREGEGEGEGFARMIDSLAEGETIFIELADKSAENYAMKLTKGSLSRFAMGMNGPAGEQAMCVVTWAFQPRSALFWQTLEHTWFDPLGPNEGSYLCIFARWNNLIWTIGVVPGRFAPEVEEAARIAGLVVIDGPPAVSDGRTDREFPIRRARSLRDADGGLSRHAAHRESLDLLGGGKITFEEFRRRVIEGEKKLWHEEVGEIDKFHRERAEKGDASCG